MILWLVLAALTIVTVWMLVRPVLRGAVPPAPRSAYDREVYRDQLAELARDRDRGLIGAAEFQAAEREIARRLLATAEPDRAARRATKSAAAKAAAPKTTAAGSRAGAIPVRRWTAFAIIAIVPIAAFGLYLDLGAPDVPDYPFAQRAVETARGAGMPDLDSAIRRLEDHLAQKPDDLKGWVLLARSYGALSRYAKAVEAYEHALKLGGNQPDIESAYGEMLVMQAGGLVTAPAMAVFAKVHTAAPGDPRARFYLGLARAQAGDGKGALEDWLALEAEAAANAPWLPALRAQMAKTAKEFKLDLAKLRRSRPPIPPTPPASGTGAPAPAGGATGPSQADVAAAANMTPEQRQRMIRGMVDQLAARLKSQPDDLDGWRRLGRAYWVLGEPAKAADALDHAARLAPKDPQVLVDYGDALLAEAKPGDKLPRHFVEVMRQVLALDGQRREALWYVGEAEAEQGDKRTAAALWGRLLAQLSPGTPEFDRVKRRIDSLGVVR